MPHNQGETPRKTYNREEKIIEDQDWLMKEDYNKFKERVGQRRLMLSMDVRTCLRRRQRVN